MSNVARMLDNAAAAAQHRPLLDEQVVREAVYLNCIKPLEQELTALREQRDELVSAGNKMERALEIEVSDCCGKTCQSHADNGGAYCGNGEALILWAEAKAEKADAK